MRVFENESFLIVDKPPGTLSVPSRIGAKDPRPCALAIWQAETGARLWAVHRLDAEVSGVLCFAKSPDAHRLASQWFEHRAVKKLYEAVTEGESAPAEPEQRWESRLARGKRRAYEAPFGKPSLTEAQFSGPAEGLPSGLWLWRLIPHTGRPHQIRFELFKHGYPVWGDSLYGAKLAFPLPSAIALRAVRLDFTACSGREPLGLPAVVEAQAGIAYLKAADPAS